MRCPVCFAYTLTVLLALLLPVGCTRPTESPIATPLPSTTVSLSSLPSPRPTTTPLHWHTRPPTTRRPTLTPAPQWVPTEHPEPILAEGALLLDTLAPGRVYAAAWNPDGTRLAYAYHNSDRTNSLEITAIQRPSDGSLVAGWAGFTGDYITWTPDGSQILSFGFNAPEDQFISLIGPEESEWRWLKKGDFGNVVPNLWVDDTHFLYWTHCGTGCGHFFTADIVSGESERADFFYPSDSPSGDLQAQNILFSPDRRWIAVTTYMGMHNGAAGQWENRDKLTVLGTGLESHWVAPQFWDGSSLAFLVYPPEKSELGDWPARGWPLALYIQDMQGGQPRMLARGASRAFLDPTGQRAVFFMTGEPQPSEEGLFSARRGDPYLVLLEWPTGRLLQTMPIGVERYYGRWDEDSFVWSPDGSYLVFRPRGNGLAWMDRNGQTGLLLSAGYVQWAEWGADGVLAVLVKERVLLVRVAEE